MNFLSTLFVVLIICCVSLSNCLTEKFILDSADLIVERENVTLEAFRSNGNLTNPKELHWACLGTPRLIKKNGSYFQFTKDGLFVHMDLSLTKESRLLLADKALEKYSPDIRTSQIVDMPLSNMGCNLESVDSKLKLTANVAPSLNHIPAILFFSTVSKDKERKMLKKKSFLKSVILKCELVLNEQILSRFSLAVSKNYMFRTNSDKIFNEIQKIRLINRNETKKEISTTTPKLRKSTSVRTLTGHTSSIGSLVTLNNGHLASGSEDGKINIWNVEGDDDELVTTITAHTRPIHSLVLLNNDYLASCSDDRHIKIWNVENNGELVTTLNDSSSVLSLVLLENGNLASGNLDGAIKIWNVIDEGGELVRTLVGHVNAVHSLVVYGEYLISGSHDTTIIIWNSEGGDLVRILSGHTNIVSSLVMFRQGYLASGSWDATIKIWDLNDGDLVKTLTGHTGAVYSLVLLSNGNLASGDSNGVIKIWNAESDKHLVRNLTGHSDAIGSLTLLNNGYLASGSSDATIKIWPMLPATG